MNLLRLIMIFLLIQTAGGAQETHTYIAHYSYPFPGAQVYKDPRSGTLIYVETDGRHVAAISPEGKLLWRRDPFKDANVPYYRFENPQVVYLGRPSGSSVHKGQSADQFVAVSLANSQFGLVRISTGEFLLMGQD